MAYRVALVLLLLAGCWADPGSTAQSRSVLGGAPDANHPGVAALVLGQAGGPQSLCTGLLVDPRVVVTAAHCVYGRAPADLRVLFGASITAPDETSSVAQIVSYPRFTGPSADARAAEDIAALVLANPASPPTIAYATDATDFAPKAADLVGFGLSDPNAASSSGLRRAASVMTTSACDRLVSFGDAGISACVGDSGGPLLTTDSTGRETALALVSFGSGPSCGAPVYAVRLAPFAAWLDSIVAGRPDVQCASTCPPAQTTCLPAAPPEPAAGCQAAPCGGGDAFWAIALAAFAIALRRFGARALLCLAVTGCGEGSSPSCPASHNPDGTSAPALKTHAS